MNCRSMDTITEAFYHLNKMLIATKHIIIIIIIIINEND